MSNVDITRLLSEMRNMAQQAQGTGSAQTSPGQTSFAEVISKSIESVDQATKTGAAMSVNFETGQSDANIAEVMLALQKADLSFRAMTEVRNRLISAYQEIMNMPV